MRKLSLLTSMTSAILIAGLNLFSQTATAQIVIEITGHGETENAPAKVPTKVAQQPTKASTTQAPSAAAPIEQKAHQLVDPHCRDVEGFALREQICVLTNKARAVNGLAPLTLTNSIDRVAQAFAVEMATKNFFDHVSPDGRALPDRYAVGRVDWNACGENIAVNGQTAEQVVSALLKSPLHRANIMNPAYHKVGIGHSAKYWVQDFTD